MKTSQIIFAGFGGQGILFSGKFLAYNGLIAEKNVSWLPSYGPEMRGGTANCSVIISDTPVGSPIVSNADMLVVMNNPSLEKFEASVVPGGKIFVDSTLIGRKVERTDVEVYYVPASGLANEKNLRTLANMIITGKVISAVPEIGTENLEAALGKVISARHQDMLGYNLEALKLGAEQ